MRVWLDGGKKVRPKAMDTIIFVHGAWVTPLCWRYFVPHFADRGYHTSTPAWPFKDRAVGDQLACPDPRLAKVGIPEIVERYQSIIQSQPKPPILIGHSFGGLIVQLLLDRGFGAAGIAISSVPPRGVLALGPSPWSAAKKLWTLFGSRPRWRTILSPPERDAEEKALRKAQGIEFHLVPESRRIFWQLLTSAAEVNFRNPKRAPLLLVACGKDLCIPAEAQRRNFERYRAYPARTDFELFPDLTHLGIAEPGHDALAAFCAAWAEDRLAENRGMAQSRSLTVTAG
jgi:alpha-beta hydrolase superfamily lysophospholipase